MRWLSRARSHLNDRLRNESGVTIVFVSIVLVALLAFTAFAIDFGRIWQERRELQNGATAGVLAVAEDCARDLCVGAYDQVGIAEIYADANASDGAASVYSVDLDLGARSAYVATGTENSAGGSTFPMLFAGIVGYDGPTVGADAAAIWGTPLDASTLPLIISDCEWVRTGPGWPGATAGDLPESEEAPLTATMVIITFLDPRGPPAAAGCDAQPGHDTDGDGKLPAGFGWVDTSSGCVAEVSEGEWIGANPGSSPSTGCRAGDLKDLLGETVLIPYFSDEDGIEGPGNTGEYLVEAHGAFLLAGYNFGGAYREYDSDHLDGLPCRGSSRCIAGWFVEQVTHGGGPGGLGGEDRGVIVIKLIG